MLAPQALFAVVGETSADIFMATMFTFEVFYRFFE